MKIKVYSIAFLQQESQVKTLVEHFQAASLSEVSKEELFEYLKDTYHEDSLSSYDCNVRDFDDLDSEFLGFRMDPSDDDKGYILTLNTALEYCGLSYFEKITPIAKKKDSTRHINRSSLQNIGNTNGRDIKCRKCKEPWENCHIVDDFSQDELNEFVILGSQEDDEFGEPTRIIGLSGCPACKG